MENKYCCCYGNCEKLTDHILEIDGEEYYVCEECVDKVEDQSGYCSHHCMLGGGCDGSC